MKNSLEEQNKSLVRQYWDGKWNERRPAILDELLNLDIKYQGEDEMSGKEEYKINYNTYLNQNKMKAFTIAAILVLILSSFFVHSQNLSGTNTDDFINAVIKKNNIPGLSIAVVSHDSVIYAKGFGIKKTGGSDPIDEHTLFEAVSLTKSFTALLLGMLVDQEKIKWTDPVVKYIPDFETNEDFVTQKLTIQDLLTLRSGLLDGDKLSGYTRMELVPQIKNLKISDSFRLSQTSYNLNYTLAGLIVEIISGESWENMMKERIFSSLKMSETYTDIPTALSFNNFSTPHFVKDGNLVPTQWRDFSIYSPAEGIYSNVVDLAKWIRLHLNNGTFENHSIISPGTLADMQKPQNIAMDLFKEYFNPEANFMTMGTGWFISDYKRLKIVQMGGLSSGTTNLITIISSKKLGIIIQANKGFVFDSFVKINYKIINTLIL